MRRLVASSLGLGLLPRRMWGSDNGAGTFGAALGAGIGLLLLWADAAWWVTLTAAVALAAVALWTAAPFAAGDPGWVCIDETAGTLVALVGLGGPAWAVALVVARLADIFKVLPGVRAASRLPGSTGVVADDVVAGLYGLATGWLVTAMM
jgi:phosphatidylglycerophosphatase A